VEPPDPGLSCSVSSEFFFSATSKESDSQLAMLSRAPGAHGTSALPKGSKYAARFSSGSLRVALLPTVKSCVIGALLSPAPDPTDDGSETSNN